MAGRATRACSFTWRARQVGARRRTSGPLERRSLSTGLRSHHEPFGGGSSTSAGRAFDGRRAKCALDLQRRKLGAG